MMATDNNTAKRAKIILELVKTEEAYVRDLGSALRYIQEPLLHSLNRRRSGLSLQLSRKIVSEDEIKAIFGNLKEIHGIGTRFLKDLQNATSRISASDQVSRENVCYVAATIGGLFKTRAKDFSAYALYLHNYEKNTLPGSEQNKLWF